MPRRKAGSEPQLPVKNSSEECPTRELRYTSPPPIPRVRRFDKEGEGHSHQPLHLWFWGFHLFPSSLTQAPL